jgi:hypothetical protein
MNYNYVIIFYELLTVEIVNCIRLSNHRILQLKEKPVLNL